MYLFLAVQCLLCFIAFSLDVVSQGCSLVAACSPSHCSGFSCCRAQALEYVGFSSHTHGLSSYAPEI